ncbi:hypothetical protein [Streptomyces pini]|uniref:Uncharacterized protein n=1 Tax=Streptomyces pini TaxID=1520580 RepID=A0A1I4BW27_9ACTN|nr:hypothetical protein [Streptomyces pini]SFK73024.1 hypothetical protein SAMN05192584_108164 [Streptomyces pini]
MTTPTPPDLMADLRTELIRKQLVQAVYAADASAEAITNPFNETTGELAALPSGYVAVGYTTDDGLTFTSDLSMADVTSSQSVEPTRSDVESDVLTASYTPQETNQAAVALYEGLPLSGTGALPAVGSAWSWDRPSTPKNPFRRLLFIGLDYADDGSEIYVVKFLPRARLTSKDDEQWARSTETQRPVTFTAYRDSAVGTSCRNWVDGPGWRSLSPGSNEVQSVAITGSPTGGTYTLTFDTQTTGAIAFDATASAVQSALEALSNIDPGDVTCAGGPHPGTPVTVTFVGQYAGTDVAEMTGDGTGLTGGTTPAVTVTTTTPGGA